MRNEKKFIISQSQFSTLKILLSCNNFVECFPKRKISSLYYDTNDLKLFYASEDGISSRQKIRIRWYNDELISSRVEYKIKNAELGDKIFYEISDFDKKELSKISFANSNIISPNSYFLPTKIDKFYFPKTLISYERNYYLKGNLRITYDSSINFYSVLNNYKEIKVLYPIPSEYSVLEVKYEEGEDNLVYKTIQNLTDRLGLTLTRFSKYSNSIKSIYL